MILGTSSIREVIAFPKNRSAFCPLTQSPSEVAHDQLDELGLLNLGGTDTILGMEKQQDLIDSLSWVSRIGIEEKERSAIAGALDAAQRLAEIVGEKAGDEAPLFTVVGTINRMRNAGDAQKSPHSKNGDIFKSAPAVKGSYFKVPSILE
jgi:aspartyl-tRNA synthetase